MPKNKGGGKHKHLKKDTGKPTKFDFIKPSDETIYYGYVGKCYGNRQFDVVILKNNKKVRIGVPVKRKRKRIAEGNLIKLYKAECYSKETYCCECKCEDNEVNFVSNSEEYSTIYKAIKNSYDLFTDKNSSNVKFSNDDDFSDEEEEHKEKTRVLDKISYDIVMNMSDEDENSDSDSDSDIDNI